MPLAALTRRAPDERREHAAPFLRLAEELEDHMPEPQAESVLRTAIAWGRYAELFGYDEQRRQFNLENPA